MKTNTQSQWSGAALDGIILSLFTVVTTLVTSLVTSSVVSVICWMIKVGGSLFILYHFMKRWAKATGAPSAFGYGFRVCLCSAVICAVWAFVLNKFITPDKTAEVMEILDTAMAGQPGGDTEEVQDFMLWLEDNFAQFNCIVTLIWSAVYGLIFSAIFSRSAAASDVFAETGSKDKEEEEL